MIFAISFLHQNSHRITFGIYHKHVPPPSKAVLMEAASALISPWLVVFRETTYQTCSRRDALSPQRHDPMPTRTTLAGLGVVRDRLLCSFFSQDMWRYDPRTDRPDSGSYVILHKYLLRSHVKLRTTIKHITDLGVVRGYIMPSEPFSYPFSFLSGVTWRHDPSIDTHDLQTEVSQVREEGGGSLATSLFIHSEFLSLKWHFHRLLDLFPFFQTTRGYFLFSSFLCLSPELRIRLFWFSSYF